MPYPYNNDRKYITGEDVPRRLAHPHPKIITFRSLPIKLAAPGSSRGLIQVNLSFSS
jgi:hypothetical protein